MGRLPPTGRNANFAGGAAPRRPYGLPVTRKYTTVLIAACLPLLLGACDKKEPAGDPAVVAEAKQVWDTRCATCHGATGAGDGAGAAALNPKPRNMRDKGWQNRVTDAHIGKVIVEGGKAAGLSELMAPNPDLKAKPEVVKELTKLIRSFQ